MAGPIRKVNNKFSLTKAEKTLTSGIDELFGDGSDGDLTVSSGQTIYLSSDMYYKNLTVESGGILFTNGFRIFVNDTLINNGTIGLPSNISETANSSTVSRRSDIVKSYAWGEGDQSQSLADYEMSDLDKAINGYLIAADGSIHAVSGGQPGEFVDTQLTEAEQGSPGNPGNPGSKFGIAPGEPGGPGNPGNPGSDGNEATVGTTVTRGKGGGVVLLIAKNVSGSGSLVSSGTAGSVSGSNTDGLDGNPGNPGNPAPDIDAFANTGSPYEAGINAGVFYVPAGQHQHPAGTGPIYLATGGKFSHTATVSGGNYNTSRHYHGDLYAEDDLYDELNASNFPTTANYFNLSLNAGYHSHPGFNPSPITDPVFQDHPPANRPQVQNHTAIYTPAGVNAGEHRHGDGGHLANTHNANINDGTGVPHNQHTGPITGHLPVPQNYPVLAQNAGFINHDAVYVQGGINAGYHTHPSSGHLAPTHNAPVNATHAPHNQHTGPITGHLPVPHNYPAPAMNAGFINHNANYVQPGFNAGYHHHGAGLVPPSTVLNDPNAGNPYHTHNSGHHAAQTHHYHTPHSYNHASGSHAPNPTSNHNHNANVNAGGTHGQSGYHTHPSRTFTHTSANPGHFYPSDPLYPSTRHYHSGHRYNSNPFHADGTRFYRHVINSGNTPHNAEPYNPYVVGPPTPSGIKDPVPSPHNAAVSVHVSSHHNAGSGEIHVPASHHSASGNHPGGSHAPDPTPTRTYPHTGTTYQTHNSGNYDHGAGVADNHFANVLPDPIVARGHHNTGYGHTGSPYTGYYPAGHGQINSHVNQGNYDHGAGQADTHFANVLPDPIVARGHTPSSEPLANFGHTGSPYPGYYPAGTGNINTHHNTGTHPHGGGNVDEHFGPYLPNTIQTRGYTPHVGTPTANSGHDGSPYDGYWPAGQHNHATGPVSPLNDPTAISASDLSGPDFYGPTGTGPFGSGSHTGTVFGPGHNPGYHEGTRGVAHFVGTSNGTNFAAHVLDPSITLVGQSLVQSTGGSQNPVSFTSGIHYHPAYDISHATGEPAPGNQHTGSPYPAGVNQSYFNLFYQGGDGGTGGDGGAGSVVNAPASSDPGYDGGIVVVSMSAGNVANQFAHSNFAKSIILDS